MKRMSCSMTQRQVYDQFKTVTRRHVDTWKQLQPGDHLALIEKGMGLPKGASQVIMAHVEIISVHIEALADLTLQSVGLEGFGPQYVANGGMSCREFAIFWAKGHGYWVDGMSDLELWAIPCRLIEWSYL